MKLFSAVNKPSSQNRMIDFFFRTVFDTDIKSNFFICGTIWSFHFKLACDFHMIFESGIFRHVSASGLCLRHGELLCPLFSTFARPNLKHCMKVAIFSCYLLKVTPFSISISFSCDQIFEAIKPLYCSKSCPGLTCLCLCKPTSSQEVL